jgi:hypothetical protein
MRRGARVGVDWWPFPLTAAEIAAARPRLRAAGDAVERGGEPEVHAFGRVAV